MEVGGSSHFRLNLLSTDEDADGEDTLIYDEELLAEIEEVKQSLARMKVTE